MYSKIYGSGIPILVFHGLFGDGSNWISFARNFEKFYQIHLLDIRNHGKSFVSDKMNYDLISEDILEYINNYKLNSPILIGHSMGGRAVMDFSIKYPIIPKKIIILDISPKAYTYNNQEKLIHILKKVDFNFINTRKELEFFLRKNISDMKIVSFLSKCIKRKENGKLCFSFSLLKIEKNYNFLIHREIKNGIYHGSTLFLRGEYSDYLNNEDYNYIRKLFPKSTIHTITKSGHWIHIDNTTDFYNEINSFLNEM
ncbi:alpha/beta fold hydrolase [Blattabacterium cuenoti]|uniref:alpha/beta fold hydrolase n=1 Tax=Blattabacterium cuenoti TaxID=1653831 RepID=UPI001EECAD82|nr:alpha/beta fold hydrolase [Blattabacterium cuenoti]